MANGLLIVSIKIKASETSGIGEYVYYYFVQSPQISAEIIMSVDLDDGYDGRDVMNKLHREFEKVIKYYWKGRFEKYATYKFQTFIIKPEK